MTQQLARDFNLSRIEGVLISDLARNGPAARAGLRRGDVILKFNGWALTKNLKLSRLLEQAMVGTTVPMTVMREGQTLEFQVQIEQQAGSKIGSKVSKLLTPKFENGKQKLGLKTAEFDAESRRRLGVWDTNGVIVAMVEPGTLAEKAGLVSGDIIREINRQKVINRKAYLHILKAAPLRRDLLFLVERDGYTIYIPVPVEHENRK
jgi:serine protease Do